MDCREFLPEPVLYLGILRKQPERPGETVSEEVSDPANMKVLTLFRMSSSDIRWSGGMSVLRFDFTGSDSSAGFGSDRK
jgi:hypothetical protein